MTAQKFILKHYPERERLHKWEVVEVTTGYLFLSTNCEKTARSELDRLNEPMKPELTIKQIRDALNIVSRVFTELRDEAKEQREFLMADKLDDGVRLIEIVRQQPTII